MKRRFTEEQIIGVLREQEAGGTVKEITRDAPPMCLVNNEDQRRMPLTSVAGHKRSFGDTTRKVCSWWLSGRNRGKSGHWHLNVRSWG